mmetsp:Transcript_25558/g.64421  ORF Transcript_25558/g.64421 Transcript_25558/m.64421 type:complete len:377 (+) Transcript_25558:1330-2460(+)
MHHPAEQHQRGPGEAHACPVVHDPQKTFLEALLRGLQVRRHAGDRAGHRHEGAAPEQQNPVHAGSNVVEVGQLPLTVGQNPNHQVRGGLRGEEGKAETRHVVFALFCFCVPHVFPVVLVSVRQRQFLPVRVQQMEQPNDNNKRDRHREERVRGGLSEERQLLHVAEGVDRRKAVDVSDQRAPEHHKEFDFLLLLLLQPHLARGGVGVFFVAVEQSASSLAERKLQNPKPDELLGKIETNVLGAALVLDQSAHESVVEALEREHGDEDGDGGGDHLPAVALHVLVRVVDKVEHGHHKREAPQQHRRHRQTHQRKLTPSLQNRRQAACRGRHFSAECLHAAEHDCRRNQLHEQGKKSLRPRKPLRASASVPLHRTVLF